MTDYMRWLTHVTLRVARYSMAAVINMALGRFADQSMLAALALQPAAVNEIIPIDAGVEFALKHGLDLLKIALEITGVCRPVKN